MRLSHWLSRFFSQVRHHVVPTGNAIPRRRRAHRADFSQPLEVRCLLSAAANDDTAQVKGKSAINLNVLFNDTSPVGGLRITGVGSTSAGTLAVVDVNNDGRDDQIIFTPSSTFSGWTTFTYTVADSAGATDSGSVSVEVISNVGMVGSNTSGQLGVVGGLGGTGYEPSPTSGYTPTQLGNYTTTEVVNDPTWNRNLHVGKNAGTGSGTQGLTNTVVSTYVDSNNWSYSETISWIYDIWAYSGSSFNHVWGGYTQVFTVTMLLGTKSTTFDFSSNDHGAFSVSTSTATMSYTNVGGGSSIFVFHMSNIDSPNGLDSGTQSETMISTYSTTGSGTFSYSLPGGGVSGTLSGSQSANSNSMYAVGISEDALGNWIGGGITSFGGSGSRSSSWSGSGTYGDATFSGTVTTDSGSDSEGFSYLGGGLMLPDMTWALTGFGSASGSSSRDFAYNGTGSYSSDANGVSKGGTTSANGSSSSNSSYSMLYGLTNGDWVATFGAGSGGGGYSAYSDYSGSGTYTRNENGGAISGDLNEDGHTNSWNSYSSTSSLTSGQWVTSGKGKAGYDGHTHLDSSGSGGFSLTTGTPGVGNWSQIAGTTKEKFGYDTSHGSVENWTLAAAGWALTSGSGGSMESSYRNSDSSGSGTYGRNGTGENGTSYSVTGTITKADSGTYSTHYASRKGSVAGGAWATDSGTAINTGGSYSDSESSGTGTYARTGILAAQISGTSKENANGTSYEDWTTTSTWTPTGWTTTGFASNGGSNHSDSAYSGSGKFGNTAGSGGGTYGGTVNEDGGQSSDTGSDSFYDYVDPSTVTVGSGATPPPSGWIASSGSGSQSGSAWSNFDYSGSGTFTASGIDDQFGVWSVSGTAAFGGESHSKSGSKSSSKIQNGGWITDTGTGSASGSSSSHYSYSGKGKYSYTDGQMTYSGDVNADGDKQEGDSWSTTSTLLPGVSVGSGGAISDAWSTTGSSSGSGSGGDHLSFVVSNGTYARGTLTGSVFRKTDKSYDYESTRQSNGEWKQTDGNSFSTFGTGKQADYSGGGSFSQSGDALDASGKDIGDWSYSGTFTESGGEYEGDGYFTKHKWSGTKWEVVDGGGLAIAGEYTNRDSSGSGTYTAGPVSGSYYRGGSSSHKMDVTVTESLTSGLSGTSKEKVSTASKDGWDESGTLSFAGTTGGYSAGVHNSSGTQWNLDSTLDAAGVWTDTSGSDNSSGHSKSYQSYSGSGSYMSSGSVSYDFGFKNSNDWSTSLKYDPTAMPGPNGEEPEYWKIASASGSAHGDGHENYNASGTSSYVATNGVAGTITSKEKSEWSYNWDSSTAYSPGSGSSSGGWDSSGSGTRDWSSDSYSAYSASGSITGGTYDESGHTRTFGGGHIDDKLTKAGWSSSGSASGGGDAHGHYLIDTSTSYTISNSNGAISGSTKTKDWNDWNYDYSYDETYQYDTTAKGYVWAVTGGSGSGHAEGGYDTSSSGTGTYIVSFANGQGTATGVQNGSSHYKWDYNYDETYTLDTATQTWNTDGSGSGSGDAGGHYDYSAMGSYGSSSNGGSLEVSGSTDSHVDAKWTWDTKGGWSDELNTSGSSVSDSLEKTWYSNKTVTNLTGNYTGTTTSESSGSVELRSHSDSSYSSKKVWTDPSTWTATASGSSSGYTEETIQGDSKYSWNWTLTEPNHTRTEVGYSSMGSYSYEKDEWNYGYSGKSSSDGSSQYTYTSGGSETKDWKSYGSYSNAWTDTVSYGGMSGSGSGSGGGYSYTTSGNSSGSWSSSGSSKDNWGGSWTVTTPAVAIGSSSSGGTTTGTSNIVGSTTYVSTGGVSLVGNSVPMSPGAAGGAVSWIVTVPPPVNNGGGNNGGGGTGGGQRTEPPGGYENPYWAGFKGFFVGLGKGAQNIGIAAKNTVVEVTTSAVDTLGVTAEIVGLVDRYDVKSNTGKAIESGELSIGQYYGETAANMVTAGVYDEVKATVEYANGDLTDDEYSQRMAMGAMANVLGARGLRGTKLGNTPITKLPGVVAESVRTNGLVAGAKDLVRGQCFPAGTLVSTPSGMRPIEEVVAGDQVWAYNLVKGEWQPRSVVETYTRDYEEELITIRVMDSAVSSTRLHPYWVVQGVNLDSRPVREDLPKAPGGAIVPGRWVDAGDLRAGDVVLLRSNERVRIQSIERHWVHTIVYNFHVDDLQCYAVGQQGVLVHNSNGAETPAPKAKTLAEWLKDYPELLEEARRAFKDTPEWQGIDPDNTPVFYRPKAACDAIRAKPGESGGHHPHGLALGGPEGQVLTPTGDGGGWVNPKHSSATGLQVRIKNKIVGQL